jgi:hypothetical protein
MVGLGQRVASGIMSAQSAAEIDPLTVDPELERAASSRKALDRAMLQGVEAQATNGMIPPHFVARMKSLVLGGMSLEDAMDKVQKEAQQTQATPAAAGRTRNPARYRSAGAGAEQPAVAPPTDSQDNLADRVEGAAYADAAEPRTGSGMNFNQIQRALKKDRDAALKIRVADQFAKDADRKFLAGRIDDAARLRETAEWLRKASPAQAKAFLGTVYNAMQEQN